MPQLAETSAGLNVSTADEAGASYHAAVDAAKGLLLAAAWKSDIVRVGAWTVTPSRPSLFVLHRWPNGTISASASVPGGVGTLQLIVDATPTSEVLSTESPTHGTTHNNSSTSSGLNSCVLHFDLPSGDLLGMSTATSCQLPDLVDGGHSSPPRPAARHDHGGTLSDGR